MAYLGKTPSQAVRSRYYFTASGGETSLSGTDDNGNTLTFTDGNYVDVSLNGATLVAGSDYNTTTANTIGGLAALTASDVVEVVVYDTFSVFGGNMAADLKFKDNVKAIFGTGSDLQIYHDGLNSYIKEAGTGDLIIGGSNYGTRIQDADGNDLFVANPSSITLAHNGSPKLATTNTGVDVTGTVTADGLTVDGAGVIRLNPSSGDDFLTIQQGGTQAVITADSTAGAGNLLFRTTSAGSDTDTMFLAASGDVSLYDSTGVTQGFYWDASTQRLGLGNTTPSHELTVSAANDSGVRIDAEGNNVALMLTDATTSNGFRFNYNAPNDALTLDTTNGTGVKVEERMRVDASGNVLVGKTSIGLSTTGIDLRSTGLLQAIRDDGTVVELNRQTSDGTIIDLRKDNTTVGSIGSRSGADLRITSPTATYFSGGIRPMGDNIESIGSASLRFKDLYLSGGVYVGGTGSANYLDDYEEGTWTPAFNLVTVTHTAQYGRYVKIGRLVYCKARIEVSSIDNTDGSGIQLTIPFTGNSGAPQGGAATTFAYDSQNSTLMDGSHADVHGAYVSGTTFAVTNDTGGNMSYSQLTQTSGIFQFAFTFEATT